MCYKQKCKVVSLNLAHPVMWAVLPMQITLLCFLLPSQVFKGCFTLFRPKKGLNLILFAMQRNRVYVHAAFYQ